MTLEQWLSHLETLHPSEIELGLDRVNKVAQHLKLDFSSSKIVVVGGTNGKGSSVALLSKLLQQIGRSVGAYTSPHIVDYNERVCLNDKPVDDDTLCASFAKVEKARQDTVLTYFEFGTLAALSLFNDKKPDYILLEVGLGGRLDAVNIVDPDMTILTNVALDHIDWLGDTREAIGFEKAGIFRRGVPAIYGELDMPDTVRKTAEEIGAPLYQQAQQFLWNTNDEGNWSWQGVDAGQQRLTYFNLPDTTINLDNASAVLQALSLLEPDFSEALVRKGLKQTQIPGRFQIYPGEPLVVLDVAHNPHAAKNLVHTIEQRFPGKGLHVVIAMLDDKDLAQTSSVLAQLSEASWYVGEIQQDRGAPSKILYNHLLDAGAAKATCFGTVIDAFQSALAVANKDEVIVVTGSFFTVSAAIEQFKEWG